MMYVYVMSCGPMDHKIGKANDPLARARDLQGGNPNPISVVMTMRCRDPYAVEQAAHAALDGRRKMGEWFAVTQQEAIKTVVDCAEAQAREVLTLCEEDNSL